MADLKETFGMINTGRGFDVDGADEKDVPSGMYLWGVDETEGQAKFLIPFISRPPAIQCRQLPAWTFSHD